MPVEQAAIVNCFVVIAAVAAGLILLVWFILTLNRIQANTRRTAEGVARLVTLAERSAPPLPPHPLFRDNMTPAEVLATIEERGGRLRMVDGFFTGRQVFLDNPHVIGPHGERLLQNHNYAIGLLLDSREVSGE